MSENPEPGGSWRSAAIFTGLAINRPKYRKEFARLADAYYVIAIAVSHDAGYRRTISDDRIESKRLIEASTKD